MAYTSLDRFQKRRLTSSYFSTIISITLVLYMLGLLGLVILHTKKLSDYVKENIGFTVVLNEQVKEADILKVKKWIDVSFFVKSSQYITKEQAAKDLMNDLGEDFVSFLGYNPLLPSIYVQVKADYTDVKHIQYFEKELLKNKNVKEVLYQKSLVHLVNENIRKISFFIFGFSMLLLVISVALINNTIRLSVYAKRFLIKSMQLVGATQYFIRKPFLIKGTIHGVFASLIAMLLLMATLFLAQREIPELVSLRDTTMYISVFAIVIIVGIFFSWLSTYFAVRKYLRTHVDKLYQ